MEARDREGFYFRPGHETFPIYKNNDVLKVIENGCRYVAGIERPQEMWISDIPNIKESSEQLRKG